MKQFRAYRFPPLAQFTSMAQQRATATGHSGGDAGAQWAASVTEGFEQGQRDTLRRIDDRLALRVPASADVQAARAAQVGEGRHAPQDQE